MPSITDIQQTTSTDSINADPITQAILLLEKKQRNLGKRKEKLEGYQENEKKGQELHKDQKEALAKYSDVIGQIECVKELNEQLKKIQIESSKNQKRLSKQAADDKRQSLSQTLRQYAQIRYLLEHRPTSLKPEESSLLDKLSSVIIPTDNSSNSISRSVDTVLSIYQNGPGSIIKNLTDKTPQEVREILEELISNSDMKSEEEQVSMPSPVQEQIEQTNDIQSSTSNQTSTEYPLQFDTRDQRIPLEEIMQDNTFFANDLNSQIQDNDQRDQSPDPKQFLPTMTVVNSSINDQSLALVQNDVGTSNEEQQTGEQIQQKGDVQRQNEGGKRNYNRGGSNNYYQQQWRGPRGGRYYNSYGGGGGQRPYFDNNRGRGGSNYRGNRGGGYRGGYNRAYQNYGNGYQQNTDQQYQNVHSAPPSQQP